MKKRILLLFMVLCLAAAGCLVFGIVRHKDTAETKQQDVEKLRDQLKVYEDTVETEIPPAETPVPVETEEKIPAETEENESVEFL